MVRKRPWLFVWTSVLPVSEMLPAAMAYLLIELLSPAPMVFLLAYKMLPVPPSRAHIREVICSKLDPGHVLGIRWNN